MKSTTFYKSDTGQEVGMDEITEFIYSLHSYCLAINKNCDFIVEEADFETAALAKFIKCATDKIDKDLTDFLPGAIKVPLS